MFEVFTNIIEVERITGKDLAFTSSYERSVL